MKLKIISISNSDVKRIIDGICTTDYVKSILNSIILRGDYSYINFVYSLFSLYTNSYTCLKDLHLSAIDATENIICIDNVCRGKPNYLQEHILIGSYYDVLFNKTTTESLSKFNGYFYDDIYERLHLYMGKEEVYDCMDDVFVAIEILFDSIESNVLHFLLKEEESPNSSSNEYFALYFEIVRDKLYLFMA